MSRSRFHRVLSRLSPFSVFVTAAGCANLADGVRAVALPLLSVALTRDPVLVAGLGVAQSLPHLIAGIPAGLCADRADRRRLVVSTNLIEAGLFVLVVVAVVGDVASIPLLYAVALCLGSNEALRDTAMSTAVPALVPPDRFDRANGRLVTVGFVGEQLAGPALGGLTSRPAVVAAALATGNAAFAIWLTAAASQRHALTPDHLLGRVTGVWRTASLGAIPLGAVCGGLLAGWLGLRAPFLYGAPLVLIAALAARPITTRRLAEANATPPTEAG